MMQGKSFLEIVNEHLASGKTQLPVSDATWLRVQQETTREDPDINKIERLIICDQALTAQVLKTANSPFYRGLQNIATVRDAITRLGTKEVSRIVTLIIQRRNFRAKDPFVRTLMEKLWQHSVACAVGTQWLAKTCRLNTILPEAFFAGLLHDVGKLFLLTVIDYIKLSGNLKAPLTNELVNQVMSSLHTEYGHSLLENWNLPEMYCKVARDHHKEPLDPNNDLLVVVRMVDLACRKNGLGLLEDSAIRLSASAEVAALGLSEISLAELEVKLEDSLHLAVGS